MSIRSWSELENYQPEIFRILSHSLQSGKLSHAYLFEGPRGTKKLDTALFLAKTLVCDEQEKPCGHCHDCDKVERNTHPNVFLIRADGEVIKKDQMRKMLSEFSRSAIQDKPRICIIDDAHRMNQEASNTILKFMEEPGMDVYVILVTDSLNSLLKTIISRTQPLHFRPIDKRVITNELITLGHSGNIAAMIPEFTNNLTSAVEFASDPAMTSAIGFVGDIYRIGVTNGDSIVIRFREMKDSVLKNSETMDFFLTMLILWQKDILHYKLRHLDCIINRDNPDTIAKLAEKLSQQTIESMLEHMLTLKSRLKFNLNAPLAFDNLLLHLERGFRNEL